MIMMTLVTLHTDGIFPKSEQSPFPAKQQATQAADQPTTLTTSATITPITG